MGPSNTEGFDCCQRTQGVAKEMSDNKGNRKCEVCGGYGYVFNRSGDFGQSQCNACLGTKISQKPLRK